jgi:D-tagatose-1,6-bisphosphate aldolase subunit GatZ/KbaZ
LAEDCKYLDYIHIDPWKKYPKYEEGLEWTINMIEFCYNLNPDIQYEIGTEEAIRRFEPEELEMLVNDLHVRLGYTIFNQIKYLVIQSGTSLQENTNTGEYNKDRLLSMVEVAKSWGLLSKEHNGDYIPSDLIKEKMSLGLDSINIAPEFGLIETQTYIKKMEKNWDFGSIDKFWEMCYNSKRWEKWVDEGFDPKLYRRELIEICGHYVLSHPDFKLIKNKYPGINKQIKTNIKNKLYELYK